MTRILIIFVKIDSMSGFDIRLVFTFPPKDSTLQYKKCVHLWNNLPCIITLVVPSIEGNVRLTGDTLETLICLKMCMGDNVLFLIIPALFLQQYICEYFFTIKPQMRINKKGKFWYLIYSWWDKSCKGTVVKQEDESKMT